MRSLRHLVDAVYRLVDLLQARALGIARVGDGLHMPRHAANPLRHLLHALACLANQACAAGHLLHRIFNQQRGFPWRLLLSAAPSCAPRRPPPQSPGLARLHVRLPTAAFKAKMLVWKAIPSITAMISDMRPALRSIASTDCTACSITPLPCSTALRNWWV